ncbi:hypothetical protein PTKIN_Ptkin15bG0104600 [Pterospermum kingtungense]
MLPLCCSIFTLWLILFFFREDPHMLWHYWVNYRLVLFSCLSSLWWLFRYAVSSKIWPQKLGIGIFICEVHTFIRNFDGLFLYGNNIVSTGLILSYTTTVDT